MQSVNSRFEPTATGHDEVPPDFSRHALDRMASRGIELTAAQLRRLGKALASLRCKGGRHALVLLDHIALVVSVRRRRVVTVVGQQHLRERIFTNIDCAMLA